jgi:hypothetical protein
VHGLDFGQITQLQRPAGNYDGQVACKAAAILSGMAQFLFQDFWTWKLRTHLAGVQNNRPLTAS